MGGRRDQFVLAILLAILVYAMAIKAGFGSEYGECQFDEFRKYINSPQKKKIELNVAKSFISSCNGVALERIPMSGSSRLTKLFNDASKSPFRVINMDRKNFSVSDDENNEFREAIGDTSDQFLLSTHQYHYDIREFIKSSVLFISVIPKPLPWFRNIFEYLKENKSNLVDGKTIEQCVKSTCADGLIKEYGAVRFMCGNRPHCVNSTTDQALEQAKRTLDFNFFIVGIADDFNHFLKVLESLLPHMFNSLTDEEMVEKKEDKMEMKYLPENLEIKLKHLLKYERELYEHAKWRFDKISRILAIPD